MKKKTVMTKFAALGMALVLTLSFAGCGSQKDEAEAPAPVLEPIPASETVEAPAVEDAVSEETGETTEAEAAETEAEAPQTVSEAPQAEPSADAGVSRQDGERFEGVISIEGMEETVQYEHIVNKALGFEMDYDYEMFTRRSEADRECFISVYDDQNNPENYLEVTYSADDAETAAAAISEELSQSYELYRETRELDYAGTCIYIDASADVGGETMPEQLQGVYIIPAADGCRIATAHYYIVGAEGFGRRLSYIVKSLKVIERQAQ